MLRGVCLHWNRLCAHKTHPQLWALPDSPSHVTWEGWSCGGPWEEVLLPTVVAGLGWL